jgi:hypothetical protein
MHTPLLCPALTCRFGFGFGDDADSCCSALEAHSIKQVRFAQSLDSHSAENQVSHATSLARAVALRAYKAAGDDVRKGVKLIRKLARHIKELVKHARTARDNGNRDALRRMHSIAHPYLHSTSSAWLASAYAYALLCAV